jgi:FeS assembly SUF system protein
MEGKPLDTDAVRSDIKPDDAEAKSPGAGPAETASASAADPVATDAKAAAAADAAPVGTSLPPEEDEKLRADVIAALKTVYDPEIPADIYELGLIYDIGIDGDRNVAIAMTLTAPACPVAGEMPSWVENAVSAVPGVASCKAVMTFDPPWDMSRMSDEARLALNMF